MKMQPKKRKKHGKRPNTHTTDFDFTGLADLFNNPNSTYIVGASADIARTKEFRDFKAAVENREKK